MNAADGAPEAEMPERATNEASGERIRQCGPPIDRQSRLVPVKLDPFFGRFVHQGLDPLAVRPLCFGQLAQGPEKSRIERRLEGGQKVVPKPVPREAAIRVRRILSPLHAMIPRPRLDGSGHRRKQRLQPDSLRTDRQHARQPVGRGAAQDPEQQRLGLVARVVGGRDPAAPLRRGHLAERRPPGLPRGLLERRTIPTRAITARTLGVDTDDMARQPGLGGHPLHERLVTLAGGQTEAVIDVPDDQRKPALLGDATQQRQQHHRVATAGDGDQQPPITDPVRLERRIQLPLQTQLAHRLEGNARSEGAFRGGRSPGRRVVSRAAMSTSPLHNIGRWVSDWAARQPTAPAWCDAERRCDFSQAEERIARLASVLAGRGVGAGDRVALWLGNRGATLEALFAAARLGAIALPLNARLTPDEIAFQLDDSEPRLLLVERAWRERAEAARRRMTRQPPAHLHVGPSASGEDEYEEALAGASRDRDAIPVEPDDPVILMYTSGTTGKPKGALLPHRKALYNGRNAEIYFGLRPEDRVLVVAPLFHSLGLQILALPAVQCGASLVLQEGFDARRVWRAVADERISYLGGVPTMHKLSLIHI